MTVFIIDTYNKFQNNDDCRFTFTVGGYEYCIREVELEWGQPIFPERPMDDEHIQWKIYNTLDEAKEFARKLKQLNS